MALADKIEKIAKVEKALSKGPTELVENDLKRMSPNKEHFDTLMVPEKVEKLDKVITDQKIDPSDKKNSLLDTAHEMGTKTESLKVDPAEIIAQTEKASNHITAYAHQLEAPQAKIKESYTPLVHNKLSHINDSIRIALSKAGGEIKEAVPPLPALSNDNPIFRFLGLLTDGQSKLQSLSTEVEGWSNKTDISPAKMLAVQLKVNFITQELEFFSSLLNKALESTKTIMNVQV